MPQLDKVTFYLQIHVSYYLFIIFYLLLIRLFLPQMIKAMKVREMLILDYFFDSATFYTHLYYFKAFQSEILLTLLNNFIKIFNFYLEIFEVFFKNEIKLEEREFFIESYVYTLKKLIFLKKVN